jgi:hypothetical protein
MNNLYIFITHQNNIKNCYNRIKDMMINDFIIVQGGFIKDNYNEDTRILDLNCNDNYIGLPEKVMKTFHFLISDNRFDKYNHFIKLDDDMVVVKKFENIEGDYLGNVHYNKGSRRWHMGKTGTFWDKLPYLGEFKPFCMGGFGYLVSRNSIKKIVPNYEYTVHIYEDVYLGILMNRIGIIPQKINTKEYMVSPDH